MTVHDPAAAAAGLPSRAFTQLDERFRVVAAKATERTIAYDCDIVRHEHAVGVVGLTRDVQLETARVGALARQRRCEARVAGRRYHTRRVESRQQMISPPPPSPPRLVRSTLSANDTPAETTESFNTPG